MPIPGNREALARGPITQRFVLQLIMQQKNVRGGHFTSSFICRHTTGLKARGTTSAPSTAATPSPTPISRPPSHNPAPARLAHPALANTKPPDFVIATTDACRKVLND